MMDNNCEDANAWRYLGKYAKPQVAQGAELQRLIDVLDETDATPCIQFFKKKDYEAAAVKSGDIILDVGCGLCTDIIAFAKMHQSSCKVFGVDISPELLEIGKSRVGEASLSNVELQLGNVYQLPYQDNFFDVIHAERLFIHLDDISAALTELLRVCKPGGRLVIADIKPDDFKMLPGEDDEPAVIIREMFCKALKNPKIDDDLDRCLQSSGFCNVKKRTDVIMRSSYADWQFFLKIEEMLRTAVNEHKIKQETVDAYLLKLKTAESQDKFSGSHGRVTFSACKRGGVKS